ncbi:hypothetical protein [Alcaligenes sp. 13f]|uniref:hypothetical protein n=1 Tax=Alcaligenes sp. 13f TaxID=2841924 RepID=UPI001CF657BE|nr:hypothetical protein [Alcaligenes sp. 13f]
MLRERLKEGSLDRLIGLMAEDCDELVSHAIVDDVVVVATSGQPPIFDLPKITVQDRPTCENDVAISSVTVYALLSSRPVSLDGRIEK